MSNNYNLDDQANQSEYFDFQLGGNTYRMRYPTTAEIEEVQKLSEEKQSEKLYGFIEPATQGAPSIKEALADKRVPVLRAFRKMLNAELNIAED